MQYTAIDINKLVIQAAVVDLEGSDIAEAQFSTDGESRRSRADQWCGRVEAVASEEVFQPARRN